MKQFVGASRRSSDALKTSRDSGLEGPRWTTKEYLPCVPKVANLGRSRSLSG